MSTTIKIGTYWENTPNPMRHIEKRNNSYIILKTKNNKKHYYGSTTNLQKAQTIRDQLEQQGWPQPQKKPNPMRNIHKKGPQSYQIWRKGKYYCSSHVKEHAQYLRDQLEKCNWDKKELPRIQSEYPKYYTESLRFFENIRYAPEKSTKRPWQVLIPKKINGKPRLDNICACKTLEEALWERDLTLEYGEDYQSYAEDTRPNPYKENGIPYYWLTRRPRGGLRKHLNHDEDIKTYANLIREGITNQEELAKHLQITEVTIRNHLKKYNTTWKEFKKIIDNGEEPTEVLDRPEQKILTPDISRHYSECDNVYKSERGTNGYIICRWVNNHWIYFGKYPSESLARKVSNRLKKCGWDKSQLKKIQKELGHTSVVMSKRWVYPNKYKDKIVSWGVRHKNKDKKMINYGNYKDKRVAELVRDNLIQYEWDKGVLPVVQDWAEHDIILIDTCWKCQLRK